MSTCTGMVMVVEDDLDVRESMAEVLQDSAYRVVTAINGRDAMQQLRASAEKPCVILLDIMMPVMDATQFRAEQREDPELNAIPVVLLSAHARMLETATALKVEGALEKPVKLDMLLSTVRRFCVRVA